MCRRASRDALAPLEPENPFVERVQAALGEARIGGQRVFALEQLDLEFAIEQGMHLIDRYRERRADGSGRLPDV